MEQGLGGWDCCGGRSQGEREVGCRCGTVAVAGAVVPVVMAERVTVMTVSVRVRGEMGPEAGWSARL